MAAIQDTPVNASAAQVVHPQDVSQKTPKKDNAVTKVDYYVLVAVVKILMCVVEMVEHVILVDYQGVDKDEPTFTVANFSQTNEVLQNFLF